jgi:hypothetical protein
MKPGSDGVGLECGRHRPGSLARRHDVHGVAFERVEDAPGRGGSQKTSGIDRAHTRAQNAVEVGPYSGKKVRQ